jgi:hypothetical protein
MAKRLLSAVVSPKGRCPGTRITRRFWRGHRSWPAVSAALALALTPEAARGCACGCGIFDVATSSMFPEGAGGMAFFETDFQDQKHNWHADSEAPAAKNGDKEIRSWFFKPGVQFMFNRSWGIQAEAPYANRVFKTEGGANGTTVVTEHWSQPGDIRLEGIYTGFSPDLSTGLTFGFKLPTGSFSRNDVYHDVDRDSEIGTGSTDLLLGGFHRGSVTKDKTVSWFAQALLEVPTLTQAHYRPGVELDAAAGVYYDGWSLGRLRITPVGQVIASERTRDTGAGASNPIASGYQRILLSPGIEFHLHPFSLYADVEAPVFQDFRGNQLAAAALFKVILSYHF